MTAVGNTSNPYIPGVRYEARKPVTRSDFENNNLYASAVPVEDGFINNEEAVAKAIIVYNLSGKDLAAALLEPINRTPKNPFGKEYREDERQLMAKLFPKGCGGHFHTPPSAYHFGIETQLLNSQGKLEWGTIEGFDLEDQAGVSLTVIPHPQIPGRFIVKKGKHLVGTHCRVKNTSGLVIRISLTVRECAYDRTPKEIQIAKMSRMADLGPENDRTVTVANNGYFDLLVHRHRFIMRVFETTYEMYENMDPHLQGLTGIPDDTCYVQLTSTYACSGDIVVFFEAEEGSSGGGVEAYAYPSDKTKFVNSVIVNAINPNRV